MNLISKILTSSISMSDLNDHCTNVIKIITKENIDDLHLSSLTKTLSTKNAKLTLALNQERKNKYTRLLNKLDKGRDNRFRCLKGHTEADTFNESAAIAEAARRLYQIFENHGLTLYSESYAKESALLESLFVDLDETDMQADLLTLGLVETYEALIKAQNTFSDAYVERSADEAKKVEIIPAYRMQKIVKLGLKFVTDYTNIMVDEGNTPFEQLAKGIDDLTDKTNKKIRTQSTSNKEKKKKKDDTDNMDNMDL